MGGGVRRDAIIGVAGLVVVCLILLVAAVSMYQIVYGDRIFLGVRSMGLDLGGKTPSQAQTQLQSKFDQYAAATITFRDGSKQWKATPAEIGLRFDSSQAVKDSLSVGRSGNALQRLFDQLSIWRDGRTVNVTFTVDEQQRNAFFTRLSRQIDQPVMDARLIIQPDFRIRVTPSQPGRKLDTERLAKQLQQAFAVLSTSDIELPVEELKPQVVESGVEEARATGEKILSSALTLEYQGRKWVLEQKDIQGMLVFNQQKDASGNTKLVAGFDEAKLQSFVENLAKQIDIKPQNARFRYSNNTLTPIRDSVDGLRLETKATIDAIKSQATTDNRTIALPVSIIKPAVGTKDTDKLVIRDQIESVSTSYAGSIPERRHNVELASSRLNGIVVGPGEIFSFNEQLGPATLQAGFQTAWGIVLRDGNMQTVPSEAGGICQVATTLFQAVFWSGYQIEERYWHLYWIPKYGKPPKGLVGLDATVDAPSVDFKFQNNTPNPILIESKTQNDTITFTIYGVKPSWQVKVDPPVIEDVVKTTTETIREEDPNMEVGKSLWVEEAQDGFKSTIVRTVTDGSDVRVLRLVSTYKPSHNVLKVGTKPVAKPSPEQPPATPTPTPPATPSPTPTPTVRPNP